MKLNDVKCKNAKPLDAPSKSPRKLSDGNGLYLWVYPNNAKRWRLDYSINSDRKVMSLGVYPEVTLKEARDKTLIARKLVARGVDPALEKKRTKLLAARDSKNTFHHVAQRWYATNETKWRPSYKRDVLKRLERDVMPFLGAYPIKDIEPPMLLEVIKKIENRGAPEIAKKQLQKCGEIFQFAIYEGILTRNPASDIKGALAPSKTKHYACIDINEIPYFIDRLEHNNARLFPTTLNAVKLMMLTFPRTSELICARWDEFDLDKGEWIIPAERLKMGREHFVPLSRQTRAILEYQKELAGHWDHVFPSTVRPRNPMSNNTILKALSALGYKGKMTGHGFRSLAMSTIMEVLGYRFEVPDLQLAHAKSDKVRAAYDRAQFKNERIQMMQDWSDYLERNGLRSGA